MPHNRSVAGQFEENAGVIAWGPGSPALQASPPRGGGEWEGPPSEMWGCIRTMEEAGRGQDCFPRPHASLYPHTDYFAMECKEVCGFGERLSSAPQSHPEHLAPSSPSRPCAPGILNEKGRASESCLESSPQPFSPSWGFIPHPRIRHTDCGPRVPSVAVSPDLAPHSRRAHITWRFVARSALTVQAPSSCPFAPERCFYQPNWTVKPSYLAVSLSFIITGV